MQTERFWILLAKKKNNEASAEELEELELLLSQENSAQYKYEIIEKIWEKPLGFLPEMNLNKNTWNKIQSNIHKSPKVFSISNITKWVAAAVFVIAACVTVFFYYKPFHSKKLADNLSVVTTEPQSKQVFYLPDGTHVWMHANSKILYSVADFGTTKREVSLIGEAFFDVTKNPKVPFIIHAGIVNITVKGTAFNVKAYPDEKNIETTLLRGLIEITTKQNPNKKIYVKPNEKIIIPSTVEAVSNKNATSVKQTFALQEIQNVPDKILPETAWMKDKLEFNNETFEELAPQMESWFNVHFDFKNADIKAKRFSGVIEHETLQQTLQALQLSYHFNYQVNNNIITIF